jgi:cell division protease FtsH
MKTGISRQSGEPAAVWRVAASDRTGSRCTVAEGTESERRGHEGDDRKPSDADDTNRGWRVEGRPPTPPSTPDEGPRQQSSAWRYILPILMLALLANWAIIAFMPKQTTRLTVPYTFFIQQVDGGNVTRITAQGEQINGAFARPVTQAQVNAATGSSGSGSSSGSQPASRSLLPGQQLPGASTARGAGTVAYADFATQIPAFGTQNLLTKLIAKGVVVDAKPPAGPPVWQTLLLYFGPALLFVGILVLIMRRARTGAGAGGGSMLSSFGRSRARRYAPSQQRTTFADVAGIEEAKEELSEIVDFLREPERYRRLGARIPKGVLLTGPPGTGKTLLARAVAGEADAPFFWLSASEFVEMIVGVGASRVRDLFNQAKTAAPAIIFIDELDAIGRARNATSGLSGNDEREQTLNQILTEMDGFTGREGVIVLAATNRPEILDQALLRPGRFDRRVTVNPPDQAGRLKILEVHVRDVPVASDVDLARIASQTPGMVGADLANLVNEAALLAAKRRHDAVDRSDFNDALEGVVLGSERRIILSPQERTRTAYHESGHALLGMLQPGADPVRKVSIVPRGQALGVTFQSPHADRYGYDAEYLMGRIVGALGGRAAEEIVFNEVTTGAESDLEQVTAIARQMVGRWGMSAAIGPISVLPREERPALLSDSSGPSDETRRLIDDEVRRIVDECYERALALLAEHRERLDRLAHTLLERETLDQEEAYAAAGLAPALPPPAPVHQPATLAAASDDGASDGDGHAPRPDREVDLGVEGGRKAA